MVSGTSSPWFIRSLMSELRSSREDMVSERCRPRLSRMKGVLAPLPCRQTRAVAALYALPGRG